MDHFYENIPGWAAFKGLYRAMVKDAPSDRESLFVEVGSWQGKSAAFMGVEIENSRKPIKFVCIDPWRDGGPDLRDTEFFKILRKPLYEIFLSNTKPVAHHIRSLQMESVHAASLFDGKSVDFLMLDGDHNYPAVLEDIKAWMPKMRSGGLIAGDDYRWPGVEQSVKEYFGDYTKIAVVDLVKNEKNYKLSSSYWSVRLP